MKGESSQEKRTDATLRERCPYWAAHLTVCVKADCPHRKQCFGQPDPRVGKGL